MISITYMHNYIIKRINNSIKCCLYLSLSSSERTKSMILISAWYFNHIMTLISFNQIRNFRERPSLSIRLATPMHTPKKKISAPSFQLIMEDDERGSCMEKSELP